MNKAEVFFYRLGMSLKDRGERAGHMRRWYAGAVIRFGLALQGNRRQACRIMR